MPGKFVDGQWQENGNVKPYNMESDALGCTDVPVDHADAAGTALVTAPADVALAFVLYGECTENFAGATLQLGNGTDVDHFDDGTRHAAADAVGENFVLGGKLEPSEVLTATPTVAGTAGAYKYTVVAQRVAAT